MAAPPPGRVPVIVGVGEVVDHPADPVSAREPAQLMVDALLRADQDAGGVRLLPRLDSLDVVNSVSWRYRDLPGRVTALLGHAPGRLRYGPVGGETPVRFLHEAAARIATGESLVAAVCGAEAAHAVAVARKARIALPWPEEDPGWSAPRSGDLAHPMAKRLDAAQPTHVYPFYEVAAGAAWGQTPAEARAESAALWSSMSKVAANNPTAWLRRAYTAEEIATPTPANRLVAWPYTKLMVANPAVNQGAAVLLTSLAQARAAGIAEDHVVHFGMGASAEEPADLLQRAVYSWSSAMEAVLTRCRNAAGGFDAIELYSCFPCVPKMAARSLGLPPGTVPTVAGGLTFFGAPLNDYMAHAAAAMVRTLRGTDRVGLLYGQGGFVTRHHALVLSGPPGRGGPLPRNHSVQGMADCWDGRARAVLPPTAEVSSGRAMLETATVLYDREGAPRHGVAILRTEGGARTMARVPASDRDGIVLLTTLDRTPVGTWGTLRPSSDGLAEWSPA